MHQPLMPTHFFAIHNFLIFDLKSLINVNVKSLESLESNGFWRGGKGELVKFSSM